jgi:hypothetical protein
MRHREVVRVIVVTKGTGREVEIWNRTTRLRRVGKCMRRTAATGSKWAASMARRGLLALLVGFAGIAAGPDRVALALNGAEYDWCSPIVVRPDQRFRGPSGCTPVWSAAEIASGAEAVLVGDFTDVSHPTIPMLTRQCTSNASHDTNAVYVQSLRAARAQTSNPPLRIIHMSRTELIPFTFAALPGFSASFLLETDRSWSAVTGFFSNDTSGACTTTPCSWSDSYTGDPQNNPAPRRLRDYVDASGGANKYQRIVYYLSRPTPPVYWATSAIADLRNSQYRAWRVAEFKESLRVGGYDMVDLSHKLEQWQPGGWWFGAGSPAGVTNVATLNAYNDTYWSAPPRGYGYSEYVQGWAQLGRDLRAAGVAYSVNVNLKAWTSNNYDDSSTTSVDEAALIREVMRGAKMALVDGGLRVDAATWATADAQLRSYGVTPIPYDWNCGLGREGPGAPGRPVLQP